MGIKQDVKNGKISKEKAKRIIKKWQAKDPWNDTLQKLEKWVEKRKKNESS